MNQNLSPLESGCALESGSSYPSASPQKATYETPLLTAHGHLRDLTLQDPGSGNVTGGGGEPPL